MAVLRLAGQTFGRLSVLKRGPNNKRGEAYWICVCECGAEKLVKSNDLTSGATRSCGCLYEESLATRTRKHGATTGYRTSPEYQAWINMRRRCYSPKDARYEIYGARGVTVCDRWNSDFSAFLEDMGPRPSPEHSLDRVDTDGNYDPSNCRWATPTEQSRNRRNVHTAVVDGVPMSVLEAIQKTGLSRVTIYRRIRSGTPLTSAGIDPSR